MMDNSHSPIPTDADGKPIPQDRIDWYKVEAVADVEFTPDLRNQIENEFNWHSQRWSNYARDADVLAYRKAYEALAAIVKTPGSRDRTLPITDELNRVFCFLEFMTQPLDAEIKTVNANYLLYAKLWDLIGKAGIQLARGKGETGNRLSKAQRVLQVICAQAGITFNNSDQALAKALHRALHHINSEWDK